MATIALLTWPAIAFVFAIRLARVPALIILVLLPYLYLPEAFKFRLPGLPDLEKTSIISFSLVAVFLLTKRQPTDMPLSSQTDEKPWLKRVLNGCVALLVVSVLLTVWGNTEALVFELRRIPGLKVWDAVSLLSAVVVVVIPFYFAQRFLTTPEAHLILLKSLAISGLLYSLLMLVEVRLSPQMHNWVYGYHQHSFLQHVRDGYRPKVFLEHGIHVGFFIFTSMFCALCLWKIEKSMAWAVATIWLTIILLISRNLGALMIAVMVSGVFLLFSDKLKRFAIFAICILLMSYPVLRQSPISPIDLALSTAERISPTRAESLAFRIRQEEALLAKANQKPLTGWGGWGRNRVINSQGRDISVTDGLWIQRFGVSGWPGYLGFFGLLCIPLMALAWRKDWATLPIQTTAFAMITAGNLIYIIPNSVMSPLAWLMVGAIAGFLLNKKRNEHQETPAAPTTGPKTSRYSRFHPTT